MAWDPTTDQLLDLDGVRRRADTFRFRLLDKHEEQIGELHPDLDRAPTLTFDSGATIQRTLSSFHLTASEANDVNTLSDRVQPVMVLQNGVEFELGILMWGDDSQPVRAWGAERDSSLVDKMNMLNQGIRATFGLGKGADIALAVLGVALQYLTLDEIDIDPISADLGVGNTWSLGTAGRGVLNDLLSGIGFLPVHFNRFGRLQIRDTPDLSTTTPALVFEAGGRIIADSILDSDDLLDAPNLFKVYETSGQAQIVGTYEVPASAPHSFANRGFYVTQSEGRSGLKTVDRANKAAKSLATTSPTTFRWRQFQSTIDPRLDTWAPVTNLGETWMSTRWSFPMVSGGLMSHTLRMVY
jgi:hypothetical protein